MRAFLTCCLHFDYQKSRIFNTVEAATVRTISPVENTCSRSEHQPVILEAFEKNRTDTFFSEADGTKA
ncbi:hypothetical protein FP2506_09551 [Fulvimarina pelagi HTCC2506]|uniref:Uncharacterized protein n=1 Tax=Fulvimarina pelagi HTCC2506 TaxID=314231 RepID=Q0G5I6_9HYPH|nr:hypothetical protein FP2506_09551 [Fulvimarina pelagi HTCC2506]